jgi:hypothetical protein
MEFLGWIPCINGHLDFGLMKIGIQGGFTNSNSQDNNCIEANFSCSKYSDSHHRNIVLQSWVDWRDSPEFEVKDGEFRVIVTAEVNESESMDKRFLKGDLLIYPLCAEPKEEFERHGMNVHDICHKIGKIHDSYKLTKDHDKKLDISIKLVDLVRQLSAITSSQTPITNFDSSYFSCSIRFTIEPNGLTKLCFNSNNSNLSEDSLFIVARQAFYYLKYSIHIHKHHSTKQDSLTTITPIYSQHSNEDGVKLEEAGLRVLCQLKREMTSIKRMQRIDNQEHPTNNALGIIAYVKSLICSLEDSKLLSKKIAEREQARFDFIGTSFSAQNTKMINEISNVELVSAKSKVWLGFVLVSAWGVLNFLFKTSFEEKHAIKIEESIYISILLVTAVIAFYFSIKRYYGLRYSSEASERLYRIRYKQISYKIVAALVIVILILVYGTPLFGS